MKIIYSGASKLRKLLAAGVVFASVFFAGAERISAHGGEDHGDAKPKTETTDKGTVSHTTRVGDLEVLLKHQLLLPDAGAAARLFVTNYQTNEGFGEVMPSVEIEAANGAVTQAIVEKTATAGSFLVKIPALAQGNYTIRAKLTHAGETDTATFSGVSVENASAETGAGGSNSWTATAVTTVLFLITLALLGNLLYFAARTLKNKPQREDTASA